MTMLSGTYARPRALRTGDSHMRPSQTASDTAAAVVDVGIEADA